MNNDNQLITKANAIIQQTVNYMNVRELKLLSVLLAEYRAAYSKDNLAVATVLTRKEFLNFLDLSISGHNYEVLGNVLETFSQHAYIKWQIPDSPRKAIVPFFKKITFNTTEEGNTNIELFWNEEMIPFIVGLDSNYTQILKRYMTRLQKKPSMTLYELLMSYANMNTPPKIEVEKLREMLNLTAKSYDRFDRFYDRGIAEPIKEINEKTDLFVKPIKCKEGKDGRKVTHIKFIIKRQNLKTKWLDEAPDVKLTSDEYLTLTKEYPNVYFKRAIIELQKRISEGKPVQKNHFKWLKSRIKNLDEEEHNKQERKKLGTSVRKSDRLKREPSFDIDEIQRRAERGDDLEKFFNELEAQEVE